MQNIQDKEFDQLFKSQFEEAEIEPSSDLWGSIESKLEDKRKRALPVYWLAASIAVAALTIGSLFYPSEKQKLPSAVIIYHHAVVRKSENAKTVNRVHLGANAVKLAIVSSHATPLTNSHVIRHHHESRSGDSAVSSKNDLIAMQPSKAITHLENKAMGVEQERLKLPKPSPDEIVLAAANTVPSAPDEVINENIQKESKGIRNVGDLVNLVVDKLDKREEKVIQFETDDDNSSLVALNIGIFRFNKKKQK